MAVWPCNPIYVIRNCLYQALLGGWCDYERKWPALEQQIHLVWKQWTLKAFQKFRVLFSQSYTTELPPELYVILIN